MILDRLLKKFGVTSYLDLNDEERKTFKMWESALEGRRLTDADVALFLTTEKERATAMILDPKTPKEVDTFYKMQLDFIRRVENFLNTPAIEKESVEKQIEAML